MADGKRVRVFFSGVSVKTTGSETWMDAKYDEGAINNQRNGSNQ